MRAYKIPALALTALAAVLSLTACEPGDSINVGVSTGSGAGSSPAASTGGSSGSSAQTGTAGQAADTSSACVTKDLVISTSGGMGEGEILINFKNTGGHTCTLHGFPGVDLNTDDGGAVSAARTSLTAPDVTLANGEETRATLHYTPDTSGDSVYTFTRIIVTPPNETQSRTLSLGTLAITVPDSGNTTPPVTIDPVGTGK